MVVSRITPSSSRPSDPGLTERGDVRDAARVDARDPANTRALEESLLFT